MGFSKRIHIPEIFNHDDPCHCYAAVTSEAAAFDPVVEVVEGEVRDVLHGSDLISALTSLLITLQRLPDCGAERDENQ